MDGAMLPEGAVTGDVRVWLRAEGLAALALSVFFYHHLGGRWWVFFAFLLAPDLSMLGYLLGAKAGAVAYNIVHSYLLPFSVAILALATHRSGPAAIACIWIAHIGLDRSLGYGLKYRTAFTHTHLGRLGKVAG